MINTNSAPSVLRLLSPRRAAPATTTGRTSPSGIDWGIRLMAGKASRNKERPCLVSFFTHFWRRNAKSHPNSLRFIRRFTSARFWPARFALRRRLSKTRPPYGVSGNVASNPLLPPSPRSPRFFCRPRVPVTPDDSAGLDESVPPRFFCRPLRPSVPVVGPALPSLGPCMCCSDSTSARHPFLNIALGSYASEA
jgi:hypothetical protein